MSYARQHLDEAKRIIDRLDAEAIERVADVLYAVRGAVAACSFSAWAAARQTATTQSTASARSPA
jgi:hypothetical protein